MFLCFPICLGQLGSLMLRHNIVYFHLSSHVAMNPTDKNLRLATTTSFGVSTVLRIGLFEIYV